MSNFNIPTRDQVGTTNQAIFDKLEGGLGFVPNLYAYYAHNDTALADYLSFQDRKTTLSKKEKEVINLVVSEYNACTYCLAAHTAIAKMNGFNDEEIIAFRSANAKENKKYEALAKFTLSVSENSGKASQESIANLLEAGYDQANIVDIIIAIGSKIISNYIHNLTKIEIDFPAAVSLEKELV